MTRPRTRSPAENRERDYRLFRICVLFQRDLLLVQRTVPSDLAATLEASLRALPGSRTPFILERANSSKGEDAKPWALRRWVERFEYFARNVRRRVVARLPKGWTEAKSPSVPRRTPPQHFRADACLDPGAVFPAARRLAFAFSSSCQPFRNGFECGSHFFVEHRRADH